MYCHDLKIFCVQNLKYKVGLGKDYVFSFDIFMALNCLKKKVTLQYC